MTFLVFWLVYGDVPQNAYQGWNTVPLAAFAANYALGACIGHAMGDGSSTVALLIGVLGLRGSQSPDIPGFVLALIGQRRWTSMLADRYLAAWPALMASAALIGARSMRLPTGPADAARLLGLRAFAAVVIECTISVGIPRGAWVMWRWLFRLKELGWVWAACDRLTLCFMFVAAVADSLRICFFDVAERSVWALQNVARRAWSDCVGHVALRGSPPPGRKMGWRDAGGRMHPFPAHWGNVFPSVS
jgi:hypothetical protein